MIELLHQDCMAYMAGLPDKAFHLAIVDPPYGIGESMNDNASRGKARRGLNNSAKAYSKVYGKKQWDKEPPSKEYFAELFRVSKNQILFGANHYIDRFGKSSSCWIVWDKVNGKNDFADCELAWTSFTTAVRQITLQWHGMLQHDMKNKEIRIHPTQKPVKLYQWLLKNYAKPGDRILDTHLGSGSSAIAAYNMGFDFVGMELDEDYYKAACKRFEEHKRQGRLFEP